jgi:hypothetical protein
MSTPNSANQAEIDSAWNLFLSLREHMETLWAHYAEPFAIRLEQDSFDWPQDFLEDDIPF